MYLNQKHFSKDRKSFREKCNLLILFEKTLNFLNRMYNGFLIKKRLHTISLLIHAMRSEEKPTMRFFKIYLTIDILMVGSG